MCPWVGPHAASFGQQLWGAAQPCGVSLATGGIAPATLQYDRLTPVARVRGPRCFAGGPLLDCVPARLSPVASMIPGHVCHGPRCSLTGLGPVALEYRSCHWPGGSAGSPQCVPPWGCGLLCRVPPLLCCVACVCASLTPLAAVHRCARSMCCAVCAISGTAGCRSPMCSLGVLCCVCGVWGYLVPVCSPGAPPPPPSVLCFSFWVSSPPPRLIFCVVVFLFFCFLYWKKGRQEQRDPQARQAQARAVGAAVQLCCVARWSGGSGVRGMGLLVRASSGLVAWALLGCWAGRPGCLGKGVFGAWAVWLPVPVGSRGGGGCWRWLCRLCVCSGVCRMGLRVLLGMAVSASLGVWLVMAPGPVPGVLAGKWCGVRLVWVLHWGVGVRVGGGGWGA